MSFQNIQNLKAAYNTRSSNIAAEFYIPCLREAVEYKRAVGFFSSTSLLEISQGLGAFADHKGKMKLLISPKLDEEDYEAIKKGYDIRQHISDKIVEDFNYDFNSNYDQKDARFDMLAYMISSGLLDIKIVVVNNDEGQYDSTSMFHRKTGIFIDENGNKIAFTGSGNETYNGLVGNDEEWDIYPSWWSADSDMRCGMKEVSFDTVWEGEAPYLITIPFPEVIKNRILSFAKPSIEKTKYAEIDENVLDKYKRKKNEIENGPVLPENLLYDYQLEAIESWKKQNYRGIFSMATGSGKTFAAAGAICELYKEKKRLIVVVCCPQKMLVDQWSEELEKFNIKNSVKCYSDEKYADRLEREINKFRHHVSNFLCIITTNATFQKDKLQDYLKDNLSDVLIVVDEAHNFGADKISETLSVDYPYRLALSATFERFRDEEGTKKLTDFFGEKCIDYTLEQAIMDGKLCHYKYRPICVSLSDSEYDDYIQLTKKYISVAGGYSYDSEEGDSDSSKKESKKSKESTNDVAQTILISRARILSGAVDKFEKLEDAIKPLSGDCNILVYSGSYVYKTEDGDIRQVDALRSLLKNKLGMVTEKFTAEEGPEERNQIIELFKDEFVQALVAINCLDEGIDIPAIKTAFILASTTNPRQYIQRRGRVLRNSPGKKFATIYDFIVLPHPKGSNLYYNSDYQSIERSLVNRELTRMDIFAELSDNPSEYINLRKEIRQEYELDQYREEDLDNVLW